MRSQSSIPKRVDMSGIWRSPARVGFAAGRGPIFSASTFTESESRPPTPATSQTPVPGSRSARGEAGQRRPGRPCQASPVAASNPAVGIEAEEVCAVAGCAAHSHGPAAGAALALAFEAVLVLALAPESATGLASSWNLQQQHRTCLARIHPFPVRSGPASSNTLE